MNEAAVLTISLDEKGIRVEGPVTDKMLCYAMLEMARDAIKEGTRPEPKIQAPSLADIPALTRRQ